MSADAATGTAIPDVSVIIPYLNQPDALPRCLEALNRQADFVGTFEVIVVDNGSKMFPEVSCAQYANVVLVKQDVPGPGPARNRGVEYARAPLLAFVDADCVPHSNWLKAIQQAFGRDQAVQIIGGDVQVGRSHAGPYSALEAYESVYSYRNQMHIDKQGFSGTGNLAMRRDVFDVVGPFGGIEIAEDVDWGQRARKQGYSIRYVATMIVYHPARNSFEELFVKWDRHMAHQYEGYRWRRGGDIAWVARSIAMALSPLAELPCLMTSDRVHGGFERWRAVCGLLRVRLYRARRMLELAFGDDSRGISRSWNRT